MQEHSDLPLSLRNHEIKLSYEKYTPCPKKWKEMLTTRDRNFKAKKPVETNFFFLFLYHLSLNPA